jgi:mRNA interferase MazF
LRTHHQLARAGAPGNVLLHAGDGGFSKDSVVIVSQIQTIDKQELDKYIGTLSANRVRQILDGICFLTEPRERT